MEARVPEFLPAQAGIPGDTSPFWAAPGVTLYLGDARQCLRGLSERSVHCVVTSPPYWGLRDYGTGTWEGGSADCDHLKPSGKPRSERHYPNDFAGGLDVATGERFSHSADIQQYRGVCRKCGAHRTDSQIGSEPSPDCGTQGKAQCGGCFVCSMVAVFREVYRVLRNDGTMWLNLGDSYAQDGNLVGVPWRVALALQADGWVLRSDLPWVKRSPMPDSAENRPGKCLEYVFLLAKGQGYYFDMDAVRPNATTPTGAGGACFGRVMDGEAAQRAGAASRRYKRPNYTDRAFRNSDLWFQSVDKPHGMVGSGDEVVGLDVTPHSARGQKKMHFAVFPPALITPLILASTSEHGCCAACGRPWERVAARVTEGVRPAEQGARAEADAAGVALSGLNTGLREGFKDRSSKTFGWRRTCGCQTDEVVPATVLDPFVGSGIAVATAVLLGRVGVGIDLSEEYLRDNAVPRVEAALRGESNTRRGCTTTIPEDAPPPPRRLRGR